jgi:hypothetical protein
MIKGKLGCTKLLYLSQSEVQAYNLIKILSVDTGQTIPEVSHIDLI